MKEIELRSAMSFAKQIAAIFEMEWADVIANNSGGDYNDVRLIIYSKLKEAGVNNIFISHIFRRKPRTLITWDYILANKKNLNKFLELSKQVDRKIKMGLIIPIKKSEEPLLIQKTENMKIVEINGKQFIKGIHGLADFLQISPARAQKMKNENVFPYWQNGRMLLFDPEKVLNVINGQSNSNKNSKLQAKK